MHLKPIHPCFYSVWSLTSIMLWFAKEFGETASETLSATSRSPTTTTTTNNDPKNGEQE